MRRLLAIVVVLVLIWGGYWFVGKSVIERQATAFLAAQAGAGRVAETTDLYVRGFPNRFDLTAEGVNLFDPASGIGYRAPFVQAFAMTWKPWHIIAAFPETQAIVLPGQEVTLTGTHLMASLRAAPSTDLPLAEARLAGEAIGLTSDAGWTGGARSLAFALRAGAAPASYDLGLQIEGVAPDPALTAALSAALAAGGQPDQPIPDLPALIDRIHADATLRLSAPLDRSAGQVKPRLTGMTLRDLSLSWGELSLAASGELAPDDTGHAAGRIEISASGAERLPAVLVALGLVRAEIAPTLGNMLRSMAAASDGAGLTLPLVFKDGRVSLGPLPLGAAPLLVPPAGG